MQSHAGAAGVTPTLGTQSGAGQQRGPRAREPTPASDRDLKDLLDAQDAWSMTRCPTYLMFLTLPWLHLQGV